MKHRFTVRLDESQYQQLEQLRTNFGFASLSETIKKVINDYFKVSSLLNSVNQQVLEIMGSIKK